MNKQIQLILPQLPQLSILNTYYSLNEDVIEGSYYYSNKNKWNLSKLLSTKCDATRNLFVYLFDIVYSNKIISKLSDSCVVEIYSDNDESPSHTFIFINGIMYHSYVMEFSAQTKKIKKQDLQLYINTFLEEQTTDNWKNITDVKENNFYDKYIIEYYHCKSYNLDNIYNKAKLLIHNCINCINETDIHKLHIDDFYTSILCLDCRIECNLIEQGKIFIDNVNKQML